MNFEQIKNILENNCFKTKEKMHSSFGDGRLASAAFENQVVMLIEEVFKETDVIVSRAPKIRYWYDIKFETEGKILSHKYKNYLWNLTR